MQQKFCTTGKLIMQVWTFCLSVFRHLWPALRVSLPFFKDYPLFTSLIQNSQKTQTNSKPPLLTSCSRYFWKLASNMSNMHQLSRRYVIIYCNSVKIMLEMLTKVPRDEDVIDTALTSGVIMGVVWGQHSSLWTCEVTSAGSCWKRKGSNRKEELTNAKQPAYYTEWHEVIKYKKQILTAASAQVSSSYHKMRWKVTFEHFCWTGKKYNCEEHAKIIWHLNAIWGHFQKESVL